MRPPGRFGELRDKDNLVTEFNEKPQMFWKNFWFFFVNKNIFNYTNKDEDLTFEEKPIKDIVRKNLMVFKHDGFWQPMDTSREYKTLNNLYEEGKAPWVIW